MTNVNEFQRESYRIDQLVWDAMAIVRGERVLFCGYGNDGAWVRRAIELGIDVTVIESDEERISELSAASIPHYRGSTTMIPARENSFDAVVAFHYLHEIDPSFHAQVVSELARVGKRVIVVEPAPPSDQLGRRIAELYSKAKFEAGSFEEYQPLEYWRKLLSIVKADVVLQQFTFTRVAPRFAVEETVSLVLDAMAIEDLPADYMEELRELARQPDAQLSPLSRYVLVGLVAGEVARSSAGTRFREAIDDLTTTTRIAASDRERPAAAVEAPPPPVAVPTAAPPVPIVPGSFVSALEAVELPPVLPLPSGQPPAPPGGEQYAPGTPRPFVPPQLNPVPETTPFGVGAGMAPPKPSPGAPPFGSPFALPDDPDPFGLTEDPAQRASFGWTWEPPEGGGDDEDPPFGAAPPFGSAPR